MNVLIVGAGKVGRYLAENLSHRHSVSVLEKDERHCLVLNELEKVRTYCRDGCDPRNLEEAGVKSAEVVAAVTGDDEDNLVVAQLAKYEFRVPKVIARNNDPRNLWLFTRRWGVDVVVGVPHIILQIIEEKTTLGDLITLLKLQSGELSLVELTLPGGAPADGKRIQDLRMPAESVIVAVMRQGRVAVPTGETELDAGDELLIVTVPGREPELQKLLGG